MNTHNILFCLRFLFPKGFSKFFLLTCCRLHTFSQGFFAATFFILLLLFMVCFLLHGLSIVDSSRPVSWFCCVDLFYAISSSVVPFSSCPNTSQHQSLFQWVNSSQVAKVLGVSALASFLPKKSQGWSPSEWTGWISLQSKRLSRVFSNTTVQKHQFFGTQLSSQSNSHIHTWLLEKP